MKQHNIKNEWLCVYKWEMNRYHLQQLCFRINSIEDTKQHPSFGPRKRGGLFQRQPLFPCKIHDISGLTTTANNSHGKSIRF